MLFPRSAVSRGFRDLSSLAVISVTLLAAVLLCRPAQAGAGSVQVLVGFKQPAYVLSPAARASLLSRTRERTRIAGLRGSIRRHFRRADAMVATVPATAMEALRRDPSVAYVEEDRPVHLLQLLPGNSPPPSPHQLTPELIPWGVGGDEKTFGVRATESGADGDGVNVGVLDTGIGPHPDLDVAGGYNFVADSTDYSDDEGHGTHVAGTIASLHNGAGLIGVAPKARLYALKVLDSQGSGRSSTIIAGIEWAIDHQIQVLNMSFGADQGSETEHRTIQAAAQAGIVLVAAAGNNGGPVGFPAGYPEVIAVGAVDRAGQVAPFSSRGPELSFVAPGVGILSTVPEALGFSLAMATRDDGVGDLGGSGIRYAAFTPPDGIDGPIRFAGRGTKADVAAVDLNGAIALMERGDITFVEKVANTAAAGALGALIYNNAPGDYRATLGSTGSIPALSLSRDDGLALKDGSETTVRLYVSPNALYTRLSGTSMASPHVAGVVALLRSVRHDLDPAGVRLLLQQTATDLGAQGRDDLYGDGLVNAEAAVKAARGLPAPPQETPMPTIRAVIFDMDGLIIDTEWPDYQSWQELYAAHGHDLPLEAWIPYVGLWGPPLDLLGRLVSLIGEGADPAVLRASRRARCDELVHESMRPMAGFDALMAQLSAHDYRRGLASTSSRDWVDFIVDGLAVRRHFHAIVAGDEVAVRKPAPDVYLRAAARLGVAPEECVALEDSAPGVASARAAGMACVAVPNRVTVHHNLSAANCQVAHLGEVTLELLRSL